MKLSKTVGRPRGFDEDQALEAAMHLFWKKGYEGASLAELTEVMGVNRPSLYAIFGNKEELFRRAFQRYVDGPASTGRAALAEPKIRDAVRAMLYAAATAIACPDHPGCMSVVGALTVGDDSEPVRQMLCEARRSGYQAWVERFALAQSEGEIAAAESPEALARYFMVVITGMSVQAKTGATTEELCRAADIALEAFPW